MIDRRLFDDPRLASLRAHAGRIGRSRRLRKLLLALAIALTLIGLLGFFAAPPLIKSQLQSRLDAQLGRPVTIGAVHFNPYTLRLELDRLHIGEPDGRAAFLDVDRLTLDLSWSSLLRWAPVLDELSLQHPQLHVVRSAPQRFNFSDLLARFAGPSDPHAAPARFALANISVHNGDIRFDDQVLHASHRIDHIELGIPFLANLPSDSNLLVQPLLAARVDGSPLRITGQSRLFASSRESVIDFQLDHLDLPRYLGYAPLPLPLAITRGQLSGTLRLHFMAVGRNMQLRLDGALMLDDFSVTSPAGAPLLELGHASVQLTDVQPLISRYHLGVVQLDHAVVHYQRNADGHSILDALTASSNPPLSGQHAAPASDVRIAALSLQASRLDYAQPGVRPGAPARLRLDDLHGTLRGLATLRAPAGSLDLAAQLNGGSVRARGQLDLARSRFNGELTLRDVALAPLQLLALPQLQATVAHGRLDAVGTLQADWGKRFNLQLQPAQFTIADLALRRLGSAAAPVAWKSLQVRLASFDLAGSEVQISSLIAHGLRLDLQRLRDGRLDLASLLAAPPPAPARPRIATPQPPAPAWRWGIAHLGIENGELAFTDLTSTPASRITVHADHYAVDGLSADLRRPLALTLSGTLGSGGYRVAGQLRPQPLLATLQLSTRGIDIAPLQSLITVPLNVRIGSALLSLDGHLNYQDHGAAPARIDYHGEATLGRVRVQDKLTGDDFLRWHSLAASKLALQLGDGAPQVTVGGLALSDFYARLIVNSNGRLNLQDVVANKAAAPVSVTRAQSAPASAAAPLTAPAGPAAQIQIGQITLSRGQLNSSDNFIKPNYSANVTELVGNIGAFGTRVGPPAELVLQGMLDENSPVDIRGQVNPLTPVAFLNVKAKANGVELSHLSPYSGKYAGYPITSGLLDVNVHYLLDQRRLTANNHIVISQLTFGDRIDAPGVRHLPMKLVVALLKNAQGQIDVNLPVSGSLDDPQFSMGSLIWHALGNLIARAVTSPFRLLASLGGSEHPDLGYVEFAPGSTVLDAAAQSRLAALVQLLQQKPSLKLDITDRVDPAFDEKGLRQVMVDDLIRQAKADHDGDKADPATLKLTPDEYEHYLEKVYQRAKFPKPKNLIGLTKSQPPEVMHQLLEANMPVNAQALRQLADRRAQAVAQWLHGKLDPQRIALHPPLLDTKGIHDKGKTTRVDFGLH